jgi:hypothetical protein
LANSAFMQLAKVLVFKIVNLKCYALGVHLHSFLLFKRLFDDPLFSWRLHVMPARGRSLNPTFWSYP